MTEAIEIMPDPVERKLSEHPRSALNPEQPTTEPSNMPAPTARIRGGLRPKVLRRVREYIDENIDRRVDVEQLAKLANLSVCYFVRAFKQSTGFTPHGYLVLRRVERTMELLSNSDLPLAEIALTAGFADQSHCARRFRQHVGMSPRDYRWSLS